METLFSQSHCVRKSCPEIVNISSSFFLSLFLHHLNCSGFFFFIFFSFFLYNLFCFTIFSKLHKFGRLSHRWSLLGIQTHDKVPLKIAATYLTGGPEQLIEIKGIGDTVICHCLTLLFTNWPLLLHCQAQILMSKNKLVLSV